MRANIFFLSRKGASASGPEIPLEIIDFIDPRGLSPNLPPPHWVRLALTFFIVKLIIINNENIVLKRVPVIIRGFTMILNMYFN